MCMPFPMGFMQDGREGQLLLSRAADRGRTTAPLGTSGMMGAASNVLVVILRAAWRSNAWIWKRFGYSYAPSDVRPPATLNLLRAGECGWSVLEGVQIPTPIWNTTRSTMGLFAADGNARDGHLGSS